MGAGGSGKRGGRGAGGEGASPAPSQGARAQVPGQHGSGRARGVRASVCACVRTCVRASTPEVSVPELLRCGMSRRNPPSGTKCNSGSQRSWGGAGANLQGEESEKVSQPLAPPDSLPTGQQSSSSASHTASLCSFPWSHSLLCPPFCPPFSLPPCLPSSLPPSASSTVLPAARSPKRAARFCPSPSLPELRP